MNNCKSSKMGDVINKILLSIILFIASLAYWFVLLLAISFVFHSVISVDIYTIIKVSIGLSIIMAMWRWFRVSRKRRV